MILQELLCPLDMVMTSGELTVDVRAITEDSRAVQPGTLFVAIKGERHDGHHFLPQAQAQGAVGVVIQTESPEIDLTSWDISSGPLVGVRNTREALGVLAARLNGVPSKQLRMIGVTGTNGKTTVTHLAKSLLEAEGLHVGLLGTVGYVLGAQRREASHTTPGPVQLQDMLAQMVQAELDVAVLEVSSHALALDRVAGCEFDIVVFTNLTQDHLDFHETMDEYFRAKLRLFTDYVQSQQKTMPKRAIVNADDPHAKDLRKYCEIPIWTFGVDAPADIQAEDIRLSVDGTTFSVKSPRGSFHVTSHLVGEHNVSNMLAAVGIGLEMGMAPINIQQALGAVRSVPGRFERIDEGQPFSVVVDYAHTDDALWRLLTAAQAIKTGRILTVFGCGGDRDAGKRPKMGQVAVRLSDLVILTSDNPRTENPRSIIREIEAGIQELPVRDRSAYTVIPDRGEAIRYAIREARPGDLVLVAGKGHEDYQIIGTEKVHFDDREEVRKAIVQLGLPG